MTKDSQNHPRQIGLRVMTSLVALVALSAVTADMLKGTQWELGRAEWDRFVHAFSPRTTQPKPEPAKRTVAKSEAEDIDVALLIAAMRGMWGRLPMALLAAGKVANLKGGRTADRPLFEEPGVRTSRTVTVFEKALFGGGVIVTGHEFQPGAVRSHRSYCYGEPIERSDGVRHWVTLGHRRGDGAIIFATLNAEQATAFKLDVPTLTTLAQSHCRFTLGGL